jgi:hypothetical protein
VTVAVPDAPPGRLRRGWDYVKWPPPHEGQLFSRRSEAASYLGAWGLTGTHLVIWVLIAVGVLAGTAIKVGDSLLTFAATCLLLWMIIATHHRLQIRHGGRSRHVATAWWMGCWDPVGRLVWLPVRLPTALRVFFHGAEPEAQTGTVPMTAGESEAGAADGDG